MTRHITMICLLALSLPAVPMARAADSRVATAAQGVTPRPVPPSTQCAPAPVSQIVSGRPAEVGDTPSGVNGPAKQPFRVSTSAVVIPVWGTGNGVGGTSARACSMNARQICAGHVPPVTVMRVSLVPV